jgi:uncharacterized membrane protein
MTPPSSPMHKPPPGMARVVESNIRTLLARHHQEERQADWQDRLAGRITFFTGSMRFVCLHLVLFGLWIMVNLPGVPLPHFDPTYVGLAMVASVEAIFLSTFILITQNRMAAQAQNSPPYTFFLLNGDMELNRYRKPFVQKMLKELQP